mmetsp:Transcript_65123/g.187175  ORF Transcript_65123/g.187175 Transcript_65123/m.187175 type:complete len:149 (-) Transcript_65123:62-508(-)
MERFFWHFRAAVQERAAIHEVRSEVHDEIGTGGKRFSARQRELVDWQQRDFVPAIGGIVGGCSSIALMRRLGVMAKSPRFMIVVPALPFYIVPYQVFYYAREAEFLVEMMREDKSSKFAQKLRASFEAGCSKKASAVMEELEAGSEID